MHETPLARSRMLSIFLLATLAGCGPTIDATPLSGPYPPTPAGKEIQKYSTKLPECPYVEVAVLAGFESDFGSLEDALKALEERTRALGGDALVQLTRMEKGGKSEHSGYTATAIRFTQADCQK